MSLHSPVFVFGLLRSDLFCSLDFFVYPLSPRLDAALGKVSWGYGRYEPHSPLTRIHGASKTCLYQNKVYESLEPTGFSLGEEVWVLPADAEDLRVKRGRISARLPMPARFLVQLSQNKAPNPEGSWRRWFRVVLNGSMAEIDVNEEQILSVKKRVPVEFTI